MVRTTTPNSSTDCNRLGPPLCRDGVRDGIYDRRSDRDDPDYHRDDGEFAARAAARDRHQAAIVAACVAAFMGIAGGTLLRYLGISLAAFTIAGGVLLFLISIDMIFARPTGAKRTPSEERDAMTATNPAVFPLAVPMLVGPATITTILILVNVAKGDALSLLVVFLAFGSAIATAWACMLGSRYLAKFIGNTGIHVVSRLLGIILAGLAVQFVINGIAESPVLHGHG